MDLKYKNQCNKLPSMVAYCRKSSPKINQHTTGNTYCARKASLGLRQIFPARYAGCLSVFLPIKLNRLTAMNTERTKLFHFRLHSFRLGGCKYFMYRPTRCVNLLDDMRIMMRALKTIIQYNLTEKTKFIS